MHQGLKKPIIFNLLRTVLIMGMTIGFFVIPLGDVYAGISEAFSRGFSDIVQKVQPAVVNVAVRSKEVNTRQPSRGPHGGGPRTPPPGPRGRPPGHPGMGAGSGVIVSSDGYIVTNNHVVENASEINVTMSNGREFPARVVGTDPKTDLAVIKVDAEDLPSISWNTDEDLRVGDVVLALGSPFGLKSTVTMGIISALGRGNVGITEYEDFIQTDAPINPGNSGGPLVNMNGQIIGINTAIFSRTGGSEGIGFAIPHVIAKDITDSLIRTGKVVRGWMGVAIQELNPSLAQSFHLPETHTGGVLISEVHEDGPSFHGGMQRGDVLLEYRGEKLKDVNHLRHIVARTMVGDDVEIKVLRDGKEKILTVRIGERPSDERLAQGGGKGGSSVPQQLDNVLAGLSVDALTDARKKQLNLPDDVTGVLISAVKPGSAAEATGLQRGDLIQEVNREVVVSLSDYEKIASNITKEAIVVLLVNRRGNNLFVAVNPK